jgi:hypothetical protein
MNGQGDARGGSAREAADSMAEHLRSLGLAARVVDRVGAAQVWAGNSDRDEEGVAEIAAVTPDVVSFCGLRLGRTAALRAKRVSWSSQRAAALARCDEIAARFKQHAANRAAQWRACDVADRLKALGLPAMAFAGRVRIDLDLSPEYAAVAGPQIAAVLVERGGAEKGD